MDLAVLIQDLPNMFIVPSMTGELMEKFSILVSTFNPDRSAPLSPKFLFCLEMLISLFL
jgi:hypothetical protein